MTDTAQIITSYGRRYIVRTPDGKTYEASTRKKRVDFACGDRVHIQTVNAEQAVIETCALENADILRPVLQGHSNILLGQSGMGKSTLTNALLGNQTARTGDISTALDSGKHTTTHAQLYDLNGETQLIDSPGLQEFGLHHLQAADLLQYFPDLSHLVGQCRFHNCTHRAEPGCAVKAAAQTGKIRTERLTFLQRITDDLLK